MFDQRSMPANAAPRLTSHLRALSLIAPLQRAEDNKGMLHVSTKAAERVDMRYLALAAIEFLIDRMGVGATASRGKSIEYLADLARLQLPRLSDADAAALAEHVFDGLTNARDRRTHFRVRLFDPDQPQGVFFEFALLRAGPLPDGTVGYRLTQKAIEIHLSLLAHDPLTATRVSEIILKARCRPDNVGAGLTMLRSDRGLLSIGEGTSALPLGAIYAVAEDDMTNQKIGPRYRTDITAGSLKVTESRRIADLLLHKVDATSWDDAIVKRNILQARSPATAKRLAKLIRSRLESMGPDMWKLVRDGRGSVATHAIFAAAVKQSPLLGDFLGMVVADQYRRFGKTISNKMFSDYLDGCRERDALMPVWTEETRLRVRSSVFQMLAQAGYIESTRSLKLQTVHIADQVIHCLKANREDYVLRCLQVSP